MASRPDFTPGADQADQLRELVRQTSDESALTVAVVSGKGGVGKTNLAVNVSICLSARGQRTILLDGDLGLANADLLMNVHAPFNLSHVLSGQRDIDEIIVEGPGEVLLIPGGSGVSRLANLSEFERHHLVRMLAPLEQDADVIMLDCGAGISSNVTTLAMAADLIMVVTTPEPTSMTDAYAMIKSLTQREYTGRIGLVASHVAGRAEAAAAYRRIAGVAKRFLDLQVADFGYILTDHHVGAAVRARCPVVLRYPRCPASACMMSIARELAKNVHGQEGRASFFKRVANLFL